MSATQHGQSDSEEIVTVPLRRGQWRVIVAAASEYGSRVPREQGDGGECLDVILRAIGDVRDA